MNNKKSLLITLSIFIILCILSIFAKTAFHPSDTEEAPDSTLATETTTENKYQESDDFDWDDDEDEYEYDDYDDYETTETTTSEGDNTSSSNLGNTIGQNPLLGNDSDKNSTSGSGNGGGFLITSDDTSSGNSGNSSSSFKSTTRKKKETTSNPYKSYDEGYEDVYENDDYDWDRYMSDPDYAEGVDDAMDELDW